MISAKIIADSIAPAGDRLTTFVLKFPRIVLAEFNTHRMLSRNSASSRAIPFKKMVEMVQTDPFIPIKWMKDHKGMQGNEYFPEDPKHMGHVMLRECWLSARDRAIGWASRMSEIGLSKQLCNRLLEPFMYHTVIVTGSEWQNFFALRANPAAEIHIADLAEKMLQEYNKSIPVKLNPNEWHIPFGDRIDAERLGDAVGYLMDGSDDSEEDFQEEVEKAKVKIAVARCARVSYNNFDGSDDYLADIRLHDRLEESGHWSPFEHCARVMSNHEYNNNYINRSIDSVLLPNGEKGWCGNFRGFIQYRKLFHEYENKKDDRVVKK